MAGRQSEIGQALGACAGPFAVIAGFSLGINLLTFAAPLYMMQVFDRVLSSHSLDTLVMLTLIVGLAYAVLSLIDGIRAQLLARIGGWLDNRLGPSVLAASVQAALRRDAGQGLRDLASLRGFLTGPAITPLIDLPWTPLFLLALFVLHPALGAVGLVGGVLLFALALVNDALTRHPLARAGSAAAQATQGSEAALRNAEAIRAMGMLDGVVRRWRQAQSVAAAASLAAGNRGGAVLALSKFLRLLLQSLIMGVGAYLVIEHDTSPGAMFAASFLLGRALSPVENAIATWRALVTARGAYRRLAELLQAPAEAPGMPLPRPTGMLTVERLGYLPPGAEVPTLNNVSFQVAPGELLAVIGPSAAGKSTLARLIAGAWRPTAGQARLDGAAIGVWLASGGARHLGYLPQDVELFAGTVKDNIARLGDVDSDAVIAAARRAGLHELIMRLPRGYDSEIGEGGLRLSGGQRQRIGLARALYGEPQLLVLDEPDASLDQAGEAALIEAIAESKRRGATMVAIAHRPALLALADKMLVLREGQVERFGARDEVIAALNRASAPRRVA